MSRDLVRLQRSEVLPDRPFTHPNLNIEDLAHLQYLAEKLRQLLGQPEAIPARPRPYVLHLKETCGRHHRVAFARPEELLTCAELAVVGFCGDTWPEVDRAPLYAVDGELLSEFMEHPHLLSYSSLEIDGGNWRNLVLFSNPHGIGHWAMSVRHAHAARVLSPAQYRHIRIHNGVLSGGLMSGDGIRLIRTKYYDFQNEPLWWAVREL